MTSLTARTVTALRAHGFHAQNVEQTIPRVFIKRDLFNCIDIVAVGHGVLRMIQVTSMSNMSARRKKIMESPAFPDLLAAGVSVELWGWRKRAGRWSYKLETLKGEVAVGNMLWQQD